ncbi:APC family permease [Bacillus badius]|uniref:Amino acid permease-associated region n=1 Tax=Bacillus badius TaxID=1455 RepID=A0ABR5AYI2_BACBA|nr:APC family permease [Bacillus badius]KIL75219.1 Amino acid permease-associated region [Bacillus badius]KIL79795.1 Amino acid permease-associated region [Bacillus badius]KZR60309.1 amino acid permease [Bacillus badius]MED4715121.1 APC family permease [Bacillus badius]
MEKQQDFNKVLSRVDVLVLAFGAMIGWGWVVLSGDWILKAGSIGSIIAFLLGGILVICVGLTYAEMTTVFPKTGGAYHFLKETLGMKAAFIVAWALLLGYISVVAFEAVALPTVVEYIFPNYQAGYLWTLGGWDVYFSWAAIGMAGSIIVTIINWIGVKQAAFLQIVLTLLLTAIGLMLVFGSTFGGGEIQNMDPLFVGGMAGVMGVMIMTPFLFVGFDVIPQVAEEMNIPMKAIGKIIILSVSFAVLWYVLIIYGVSLSLGPNELKVSSLATADAMGAAFGSPLFAKILILGGIAGILTSWNAFIIGGSRIMYAMAQDGALPAWFGKIHPKYKTPSNAILVIGLLSTLSPLLGRPALVWFVDAGGLAIVLAYFMVSVSFLWLRKNKPELERPFRAGKSNVIGWSSFVLTIGFIILYMPGMPSALIWPYEWIITLAWWAVGFYFLFKKTSPAKPELSNSGVNENVGARNVN